MARALEPFQNVVGELLEFTPQPLFQPALVYADPRAPHVYRTGHPAIDALRSVSGVYKQIMVRGRAR